MATAIPGRFGLDDPSGNRNLDGSISKVTVGSAMVYPTPIPPVGSYPGTSGLNHPDGGTNADGSIKKIK